MLQEVENGGFFVLEAVRVQDYAKYHFIIFKYLI